MAFFIGLVVVWGLLRFVSLVFHTGTDLRADGILAAAIMFTLVGISHFAKREKLEAMIPAHWPHRRAMNYISGAAEIAFGIGLLFEATRLYAAIGLLLLLAAVFPANIYMAKAKPSADTISRLFFQPVYMPWVWWFCMR